MQSQQTAEQRSGAGVGGLVRRNGRRSGVGRLAILTGLLLFPLHVGAQGPGDLDTSFGDAGLVLTDVGHQQSHNGAYAVAVQPDGKIVVAGEAPEPSGEIGVNDYILARYLPNGTLDETFGDAGQVTTDFGNNDYARAVAVQLDGKIVVAGGAFDPSTNEFNYALARYHANGMLDTTFGGTGQVTSDFDGLVYAIVLQPDGKIVVAGTGRNPSTDTGTDFTVVRYLPDGTLDTAFGGDGLVFTDVVGSDFATAVALQPNGKIVVAGYTEDHAASQQYFAVARYHANGTLDTTFSSDGRVTTKFEDYTVGSAVVLQPDGKIVVAGSTYKVSTSRNTFALARYNPNGTLDTTFSSDGRVTTKFGKSDVAMAVALQLNGRIVAAGYTQDRTGHEDFALARYNPNGTLDTAFGGTGKVTTDFGGDYAEARALVTQPYDGRLVVVGVSNVGVDEVPFPMFALARYHAIMCNGVVATRVGTDGDDTIMGTAGNDVISSFGGNDLIDGLGGHDILCGGSGNDTLRGAGGNDLLDGNSGTDRCNGGSGSRDQAVGCEQVTEVP